MVVDSKSELCTLLNFVLVYEHNVQIYFSSEFKI